MTIFKSIFASILIFSFFGCDSGGSGDSNDGLPTVTVGGKSFKVSSKDSLTESAGSIDGSAAIISPTPSVSAQSGLHFSLQGVLSESGSSLTVHAFSDGDLNNGLDLVFSNVDGAVQGTATVGGESVAITNLTTIKPESFAIEIDVHNDETPVHVLVWPSGTDFEEESALFNSEEDGELGGNASGTYWGLTLKNIVLNQAVAEDPKFEEE